MGLFSKSKTEASDAGAGSKPGKGASSDADIVREARTSARRRLIGAALLLGIGIIGFPLLFETQPRPIPVDIQIDIPSKDSAAPLAAPASRVAGLQASPQASARPAESGSASGVIEREVVEAALPPTRSSPVEEPETPAVVAASKPPEHKPPAVVAAKPAEKPAEKPVDKPAPAPTAADDGRYVVQIGAFAEANGAREARMKVERMGMKTYTQVIESATGRRIRVRVGPYSTKTEAEKAANKIKAGGLQAAILLL